jgi:putative DNA primase/helicase
MDARDIYGPLPHRFPASGIEPTFRQAMRAAGLVTDDEIIADGELHRVHITGDRPGSSNGWYVLHTDNIPAGVFGSWRTGISQTWRANVGRTLTSAELALFEQRMEKAREESTIEKKKQHAEGQRVANFIWQKAAPPCLSHNYLQRKRIRPDEGIRQWQGKLVIPLVDASGLLHGLQKIAPDGQKRFTVGTAKQGHFHIIKSYYPCNSQRIGIVEGYATGASVHEATSWPVYVAFDAGNLRDVATVARMMHPDADIIICADNDHRSEGNLGVTKALEAAAAAGGSMVAPTFDAHDAGTDWNDYAAAHGIDATRSALESALGQR